MSTVNLLWSLKTLSCITKHFIFEMKQIQNKSLSQVMPEEYLELKEHKGGHTHTHTQQVIKKKNKKTSFTSKTDN